MSIKAFIAQTVKSYLDFHSQNVIMQVWYKYIFIKADMKRDDTLNNFYLIGDQNSAFREYFFDFLAKAIPQTIPRVE